MQLTLVTGSEHKLREWQRLVPSHVSLQNQAIDLPEIQSFDSIEIVRHKLHQAYDLIKKPVVVEDVSAGLDKLNGLPGPFIKFFEQQLGRDALYKLAGEEAATTITCTIGYFDGEHELFATGIIHGRTIEPEGETGFGFDFCFIPDGEHKTFAQMPPGGKDAISHRRQAIDDLIKQLDEL